MTSNVAPPSFGRSSPTPPPPPPKETRERSPLLTDVSPNTSSPTVNGTKSPVRRKPLPLTALSPPRPPPPLQNKDSTQIFSQVIQHLGGRPQATKAQADPLPQEPTSFYHHQLDNDQNLAPHVSAEDFPRPPSSREQSSAQPNDFVDDAVIVGDMALKPGARPAPVRTDSSASMRSQPDQRKPQTPGSKFTSFFSRKQTASPGAESIESSERAKSPLPSPYPNSPHPSAGSARDYGFPTTRGPPSQPSQDSIEFDASSYMQSNGLPDRASQLEAELREVSKELASSIKREMDLEDMVERLQAEAPLGGFAADRTSDYFSDSGTSSIRPPTSEYNPKEEIERLKRDAEQQRAQLKVDFSQRWQRELATRKAMESHLQYVENKLKTTNGHIHESTDMSARAKELESALEDAKRKLSEEKQTKENFQDLLSALQEDLEQHRNDRDNLRDEVVPQLKSRIEGLEASLADAQKSPYDVARMQHEIQSLRDENMALHSARMMNAQFESIAEDGQPGSFGRGLQRSGTMGRSGLGRSNSLARSNSIKGAPLESAQSLADQLKAVEQQRDALHNTVKYLLRRQTHQTKQYDKKLKIAEIEKERASHYNVLSGRKPGYEREVRGLRAEINLLRKRADEAMEQKWQCEKGLAGLKMDLDRSKQETESLQKLLQAKDNDTLERALDSLQRQRVRATTQDSLSLLANEQEMSQQLEASAERSEALAVQVQQQLKTNSTLRSRLKDAIEKGECDQLASAQQISELQETLRKLEDTINAAQTQSETLVMKHEEDVRVLRASNNLQLLRAKSSNPDLLKPSPRSPLSPMFANSKKSPRLDRTSSGPGVGLQESLKTEFLERKVDELEKALAAAEREMGEVVGRMNTAQIGVFELEGERDDALRQTRKLENEVAIEKRRMKQLLEGLGVPEAVYNSSEGERFEDY